MDALLMSRAENRCPDAPPARTPERLEDELRFLADAGELLSSSLDYESTVQEVTELVVPTLADWCVIDVLDENGGLQSVQIAAADPAREALLREMLHRFPHTPSPPNHPIERVLATRQPVLVREVTQEFLAASTRDPEHLRLATALQPDSALFLPLCVRGQVVGAMTLVTSGSGRQYTEHDLWLAGEVARRAALAIENARLYRRAQAAVHAREEVLGIVAHDLRNPLGVITMVGSLLLEGYLSPDQTREQVLGMLRTAEQMDRLIEDLLDVARIDAGTLAVDVTPVDVASVVREAVRLLEPAAREGEVEVRVELEAALPTAAADADRVLQVLSNLMTNAVRHSPRGGAVAVHVRRLGGELLLSVTDSGPGIAPEHMPHLFDRFWQARPRGRVGTGLGLSIAHGIVEAHGGRIWATSEPGSGATFLFTIPLSPAVESAAVTAHASLTVEPVAEPEVERIRVLVVDDHPIIRRGVRGLLERAEGIEVVAEAGAGEEAEAIAARLRPDVVVMDLSLPGISGLEAMRRITAARPETRVVALTAETEGTSALAVLEAGGSGFVEKTDAHDELVAAVRTAARDEVYLHGAGNRLLLRALQGTGPREDDPLAALSPNEREILTLAAQGYTASEIGRKLYLSASTVASYRSRAMRRLGLHDRASLVRLMLQEGLMEGVND